VQAVDKEAEKASKDAEKQKKADEKAAKEAAKAERKAIKEAKEAAKQLKEKASGKAPAQDSGVEDNEMLLESESKPEKHRVKPKSKTPKVENGLPVSGQGVKRSKPTGPATDGEGEPKKKKSKIEA
jgi:colicin import membrane protein